MPMTQPSRLTLDPGAELRRLLMNVRESLAADTAVMLLVDATGAVLEPFASSGLDVTLRTGARVPVGQGFAGAVAGSGRPVVIDDITEADVINPMLRRRGLRSLLGVPLVRDGSVFGVLHVGTLEQRSFTCGDVAQLEALAEDVAAWFADQSMVEHHMAARVLQRSLIPTLPPSIPGLDVAGRYVPAEGDLGGDWYDVFVLPDGRVGLVMGDVLGHGLQPAVVMGRIRSALRSYALIEESPARVLEMLDRKISHFEAGTLATVLFAVSQAPYDSFVVSSAGHWPPLVADGQSSPTQAELTTDLMLGLMPERERTDSVVAVAPGGSLCMFTDGLIEQRFVPGGAVDPDAGIAAVAGSLSAARTAEANCVAILADLMPEHGTVDDVALLVIGRDAT
jgi:sigma-B regulation protein RsbU (phosphoserine phosphatase)